VQFGEELGDDVDAVVLRGGRRRGQRSRRGELPFAGLVDGAGGAAAEDDAVGAVDDAADGQRAGADEGEEVVRGASGRRCGGIRSSGRRRGGG
jgi:hypothetical protein